MMPVNQKAPVVESGRVEVAAGMEAVWQTLAAVERWPEWNPDIRDVLLRGPLAEGSTFTWRFGRIAIASRLLEVEPPRFIAWRGTMLGITGVHVWRLDRTAGGTVVTTEESWDGLLPRLLRGRCRRMLRDALVSWLAHLKQRIEGQQPEAPES
jgi:hypothetical protein